MCNIKICFAVSSICIVFHLKLLQQQPHVTAALLPVLPDVCLLVSSAGSGSFSLSGSADLFLGVPPVNGEQSAYQMGVQVHEHICVHMLFFCCAKDSGTEQAEKEKLTCKVRSVTDCSSTLWHFCKLHSTNYVLGHARCFSSILNILVWGAFERSVKKKTTKHGVYVMNYPTLITLKSFHT